MTELTSPAVPSALLSRLPSAHTPRPAQQEHSPECPGDIRALVFGGGGVRGAYQVGALWYLTHVLGCTFDHYIGTSTGAISAAVLAPANNQADLKRRVDILVDYYLALRDRADLVDARWFGELRLLLPHGLGGVDGLTTLVPVEKMLDAVIDKIPIPQEKLTITALSLQTGPLFCFAPYFNCRPDSWVDFVLGSASFPYVVEPRWTRLWMQETTTKDAVSGDQITLRDLRGVPDPDCQIRLAGKLTLRCEHTHESLADGSLRTIIKLLHMSDAERSMLQTLPHEFSIEFTTMHQLVDGGVTDHLPLQVAYDVRVKINFDTLIVLPTGTSLPPGAISRPVNGIKELFLRTFENLWFRYQDKANSFDLDNVAMYHRVQGFVDEVDKWSQEVRQWQEAMEKAVGRDVLAKLENQGLRFPRGRPQLLEGHMKPPIPRIVVIDPGVLMNLEGVDQSLLFNDTFDVNPAKIRRALLDGCRVAALAFTHGFEDRALLTGPGDLRKTGVFVGPVPGTFSVDKHGPACARFN